MRKSIVLTCLFSVVAGAQTLAGAEGKIKVLDVPLYGQKWNVWCWATSGQMVIDYLYQERFREFLTQPPPDESDDPAIALRQIREALGRVTATDLPRSVRQCEILNQRYSTRVSNNIERIKEEFGCLKENDPKKQEHCLDKTLVVRRRSVNCCADDLLGVKEEDREICVQRGMMSESIFGAFGVTSKRFRYRKALSFEQLVDEIDAGRPVLFSWSTHMMVAVGYVFLPGRADGEWVVINDPWPTPNGDRLMISYADYVNDPHHLFDFWGLRLTERGEENWRRGDWSAAATKEQGERP